MNKLIITIIIVLLSISHHSFSQEYDAELINYQTAIRYQHKKLIKTTNCNIKINNRNGDIYTQISIPYSKINTITKLTASIKNNLGIKIKDIKKKEIKDRSCFPDFSFYSDYMVKEFTLKHNEYPYILSYSYNEECSEFINIDYWQPVLSYQIPTLSASLSIELPISYGISYRANNVSSFHVDTLKNTISYNWNATYNITEKPEIFMPNIDECFPRVVVVPINFRYDISGSFKSWESFGNWEFEMNKHLSDLPESEISKVKSLINGITNKREQVKIIYHYLQDETRYVSINIKTGGLKPFPASFVSTNKYGDCKALANYMMALLQAIGINSYYTDIYADNKIRVIDKTFPSQQFNHVILYIPLNNDSLWVDCTSDGPFNYLGTFTQNRNAFVVEKNHSHFKKTPALGLNDVLEIRHVEFSENKDNETSVKFENTYRGSNFQTLMYISKSANQNWKTNIIYDNYADSQIEPKDFGLIQANRDSCSIKLIYNASSTKIYGQYGSEKIIQLLTFKIPEFKKPAQRTFPLEIDYPINKLDTIIYNIPETYTLVKKPENKIIYTKFGTYSLHFDIRESTVQVIKSFTLLAGYYAVDQYPELYNYIKKVNDTENNTKIILNKQN